MFPVKRLAVLCQGAAATAALLSCLGPLAERICASTAGKVNFVFILIDDMGWTDVGVYGSQFHDTPRIDGLAAQGMRFTAAYAAAPVCSPTRVSILSGQYPARVGVTDFITGHWRPFAKLTVPINRHQYLPLEVETLAEALKPVGYATATFGKWHLGGPAHHPDKQGFDRMVVADGGRHFGNRTTPNINLGQDEYLAEAITEQAEQFIEANRDQPFFLYLSHYAVHIPLEARRALVEKYRRRPKPASGVNNPTYAAMVEHVDHSVGRILDKLDALDLTERTMVVFFSDNGGLRQNFKKIGPIVSSNAPLRDEKGTLYEGGIREPLIVRWPGVVKPGSVCDTPVTSVDFYPTFLQAAGIDGPPGQALDGESLLPLLRQSGELARDAIYWHYPHYHHSTPASAIREGDWKLIEFFEEPGVELYNLAEDVGEHHNLVGKMPDRARRLQGKLAAWRTSVSAELPRPNQAYDPDRAGHWGTHPSRRR